MTGPSRSYSASILSGSRKDAVEVVVIGGGIIGCAAAWELARRGADVMVIERGIPGGEATAAAGGMLSPLAEAGRSGPFLELGLRSLERYPGWLERVTAATGAAIEYSTDGKIEVAGTAEEREALSDGLEWRRQHDSGIEWLEPDDVRSLEPAVRGDIFGGVLLTRDHVVDNRELGRALSAAAAGAGVRFRLGEEAVRVLAADDYPGGERTGGVELAGGDTIACGTVVVCAGAWSGQLAIPGTPLPVFPIRGQMAAVRVLPRLLQRVVQTAGCYMIPRASGRVVIGATQERVGFQKEATVAGVCGLLESAAAAVPELGNARLESTWAGLRPGTPDDLPIIGADPSLEGLFYASGHFRNGILLAPITAELIADLITGAEPAIALEPFSAARFGSRPSA